MCEGWGPQRPEFRDAGRPGAAEQPGAMATAGQQRAAALHQQAGGRAGRRADVGTQRALRSGWLGGGWALLPGNP